MKLNDKLGHSWNSSNLLWQKLKAKKNTGEKITLKEAREKWWKLRGWERILYWLLCTRPSSLIIRFLPSLVPAFSGDHIGNSKSTNDFKNKIFYTFKKNSSSHFSNVYESHKFLLPKIQTVSNFRKSLKIFTYITHFFRIKHLIK